MLKGKYLNKYYKKYGILLIAGILITVIVDYVQLFIPEYLGKLVDLFDSLESVHYSDIADLVKNILLVATVLLLGRFGWRICIFQASSRIESGLRYDMFLKSERLSQRYYHENKVGSIMAWFSTDLECIEEYVGFGTIMSVDALFLGTIIVIKMMMKDFVLSFIAIVPMLLIVIWGALAEKYMSAKWEERQKNFDALYDFTQENFTGIRVIKAFVKEVQEFHAFAKIAQKNADMNLAFARLGVLFDVCIEVIISAIMALVIGFGSYFVYSYINGTAVVILGHTVVLSAGELITFVGYVESLIWPMVAMGQIVSMRSRAKASLKRVTAYLDEKEEIFSDPKAEKLEDVKGKITFKNYCFEYPDGGGNVLEDISFEIQPGENVGVIGKIGSGKTTLVNSLLRLYNIKEGSIFIDDKDIMKVDIASLRDNISYVPQDNFLFSDEIKNNIAFANRKVDFEKVKEAAVFADIDENIADFKSGYETMTGERGVTLSGGQKQRISIARAYLKDAPIMIMDDSVSAVDVKTEETILDHIREKRKGKTTIVIASRLSTVSHLDKIVVLNEGKLEAFGTPEELLKRSATYQKMYYLQQLDKEVN